MKKFIKWLLMAAGLLFFLVIAVALLTTDDETSEKTSAQSETKEKEPVKETEEETIDLTEKYAAFAKSFVPKWTDETLELSDTSYVYIHEHYTLFPAFEKADISKVKKMEDTSVSVKMLNKNVTPYYKKIVSFEGSVVSIEEMPLEESEDTVSLLHVIDDAGDSYQVLLFKGSGDILEEDEVRFWGAPLGPSSFENVSGGTTNVQVFMGSHVEKLY
ncbi:hypothetical protein [uncultured Exiguobacterium sp.]|uniref:hypothetical protein n=1 Tax=uncultured Exiguobacterium sp. TaxID=202669 RepID=UPI00374825ED